MKAFNNNGVGSRGKGVQGCKGGATTAQSASS
jgi:hypothetical protein